MRAIYAAGMARMRAIPKIPSRKAPPRFRTLDRLEGKSSHPMSMVAIAMAIPIHSNYVRIPVFVKEVFEP